MDHVVATVEEEEDIVSTMRMPNRLREVCRLGTDLKERPKRVVTEVGIVAVEDAVDIVETVLRDKREITPSGEISQLKLALPMLKAVHMKKDLPDSITRQEKVKKVERDLLTNLESTSNMILERIR